MSSKSPSLKEEAKSFRDKILGNSKLPTASKISGYVIVRVRALFDYAEYVEQHLSTALMFPRKNKFWDYVASKADLGDGLNLNSVFSEVGPSIT